MAGVVHISKEDAARDFDALIHRVHDGEEIVVEDCGRAVAVMKAPGNNAVSPARVLGKAVSEIPISAAEWESVPEQRRSIADAVEILRAREAGRTSAVADPDFAADMEAVRAITNAPMDCSRWD